MTRSNWPAARSRLENYFLPEARAIGEREALRGGPQYRLQGLIAAVYEHTGIALGIARRALKELTGHVARKGTRYEVMLTEHGRLSIALEFAFAGAQRVFENLYDSLADPSSDYETASLAGQAASSYVTDLAVECVEFAYRFAGTAGLYLPNPFEQLLRDVHGATQHIAAAPVHFRDYAAYQVEQAASTS